MSQSGSPHAACSLRRTLYRIFFALGVAALASCEPHSAAQTVPGWAEKQAEKQKEAERAEQAQKVDPDAPSYFPKKGE